MYSVTSAAAKWQFAAGSSSVSSVLDSGDAFSAMLERLRKTGENTASSFMDMLAERYPGFSFTPAATDGKAKEAEASLGNAAGDHVVMSANALEAALSNANIAGMIEKALGAFQATAGQTSGVQGAYMQRSMTVTMVRVSVSVSNYSADGGDLLASSEMQTALSEKIDELIRKFLGAGADADTGEDGESEDAEKAKETEASAAKEADAAANAGWASSLPWFGSGVSMSFYFSAGFVSGAVSGASASSSGQYASAQFGMSTGFQSFVNGFLPHSVTSSGRDVSGSGAFTSLLDAGLAMMGLSSDGGWQGWDGGYLLQLRESRNMLTELMSSLYAANAAKTAAVTTENAPEATEEAAPEAAVAAEEVA